MTKPVLNVEAAEAVALSPSERPVPRVTIHAFCVDPETGVVLQRAAADRRLAKAHLTVQMGGLPAAVQHYQESSTPNLVIVESEHADQNVLTELAALSEVCDPGTKVVVCGKINDISLYRELIRQGISEYLVTPLKPASVIEAVASLYTSPDSAPIGRVIAFIGARGGVGSSTVAHNAAWVIAEESGVNTTLVDFDLAFGTAGLDFNQDPGQTVFDALASPERLDDVLLDRLLVRAGERLNVFAAPAALDRDFDFDPTAYEQVIEAVRAAASCVIVDLPHLWTPWTRSVLVNADDVVVTATPDLASLRNAKNIMELVNGSRDNDGPAKLVLNMVGQPKRPEIPVNDFVEAVGRVPALVLPYEPGLYGQAANNGQMLPAVDPASKSAQAMRHLAGILTGRSAAPQPKNKKILPFLDKLLRKKAS